MQITCDACYTYDIPTHMIYQLSVPGRVAQSVGHLTRKSGVLGSIPGLATYFRFSFRFFKKGSCQLLVHEVLVNRLGGLSLPRKSVVRLTDRPDMTLDVYRGRKTTKQQTNYRCLSNLIFHTFAGYSIYPCSMMTVVRISLVSIYWDHIFNLLPRCMC